MDMNYEIQKVLAEEMGLSEKELTKTTGAVANCVAKEPCKEEKMLMELWKSGSMEEQKMLAHTLLELIRKA